MYVSRFGGKLVEQAATLDRSVEEREIRRVGIGVAWEVGTDA